jgi:hypothetical protein
MTVRKSTIAKLYRLPESAWQQVSDFIDFLVFKQHSISTDSPDQTDIGEIWQQWFESVDGLAAVPEDPIEDYQQLLLSKYRQQGLEL